MAVVPSLLVWLVLSTTVQPAAGAGSGYVPTGSLDDLTDPGVLARLRDPRIRPIVIGPDSDEKRPMANVPAAMAVFWYSERPDPDPAGL